MIRKRLLLGRGVYARVSAMLILSACSTNESGGGGASQDSGGNASHGDSGASMDSGAPLPNVPETVAIASVVPCTMQGIGATRLAADAPVTIVDVSVGSTGATTSLDASQVDKPYCL